MTKQSDIKELLYAYIGRRMQMKRKEKYITQHDLADEIGLTRTSMTNIESGRQRIQVLTIYKVARALGCEVEELLPPMSDSIFEDGQDAIALVMDEAMKIAIDMVLGEDK